MDDLGFGLWMAAVGMGTVFALLVLLMLSLKLLGWTEQRGTRAGSRHAGRSEPPAEPLGAGGVGDGLAAAASGDLSEAEIAAIAIAVITHARVRRQQAAPAMRAHEPGSHLFANRWVSIGRGYQQRAWTRGN